MSIHNLPNSLNILYKIYPIVFWYYSIIVLSSILILCLFYSYSLLCYAFLLDCTANTLLIYIRQSADWLLLANLPFIPVTTVTETETIQLNTSNHTQTINKHKIHWNELYKITSNNPKKWMKTMVVIQVWHACCLT